MPWKHVGDHYRTTRSPVYQWSDPPKGGGDGDGFANAFAVVFWIVVGLCFLGMCTK